MPPKKQFKKKQTNTVETTTDLDISITFTDDDSVEPTRVLLSGRSKSGRTTVALTYPKPMVLNVDKGLTAYRGKHIPKIDVKSNIRTYQFVLDVFHKMTSGEPPFDKQMPDTLIVDDLTGLSEQYEREVILYEPPTEKGKTRSDGLFLQDYNVIQNRMISTLNALKDLPVKYVVVVSSIYQQMDPDLEGYFETPQVTGNKFPPRVASYFDDVYYVEYNNEEQDYTIRIKPTKRFPYAGTKFGIKEDIIKNPSYTKLKKYYEGGTKK